MDLQKLKAKRTGNRSAVTKLIQKFDDAKETSEFDKEELLSSYDNLSQKKKFLEKLDEEIVDMLEPEEMEKEIVETDEYITQLDTKLRHIRNFIETLSRPTPIPTVDLQAGLQSLNVESPIFIPASSVNVPISEIPRVQQSDTGYVFPSMPQNDMIHPQSSMFSNSSNESHRLPKLTLPTFTGNILNWQTFWDSYESAVHNNNSLTNVQKFNYLKAQLQDEALKSIAGFALTNSNYIEEITLLKERFGQPEKIVQAHMHALLEIPAPQNTLSSIRNFYDEMESYVRGLEALGQAQDSYGTLLVPILLKKLPGEIRKHLTRKHRSQTWTLRDLRKSIQEEIYVMDAGEEIETPNQFLPTTSSFFAGAKSPRSRRNQHNQVNRDHKYPIRNIENKPCVFCSEIHAPVNCSKVIDSDARLNIVKRKKLCFNCLGNHRVSECRSNRSCKTCSKKHHTSLCNGRQSKKSENEKQNPPVTKSDGNRDHQSSNQTAVNLVNNIYTTQEKTAATLYSSMEPRSAVLLKTAIAPIGINFTYMDANILFDEGAQRSFLTAEFARKLNLKSEGQETLQLSSFGGKHDNVRHLDKSTVYLKSEDEAIIPIKVLIVPTIAMPIQNHIQQIERHDYLRGLKLAHPVTSTQQNSFEINLLIGADHYWDVVEDRIIQGDGPTAVMSKIGYLLSGPVRNDGDKTPTSSVLNILVSHKAEEQNLETFWNLESIGISSKEFTYEEEDYLRKYQQDSIELREDKYYAKLPWKENYDELPSNITIARKRTENVIRRLRQSPDLLRKYGEIIAEQERRDFIEKVDQEEETPCKSHYIPHHPVYKDSSTTPIRIVYDCSCRQSKHTPSLNDCLIDTPPKLNDLTKILMRFRANPIAITTDIEKAFLHVGLNEADRDFTRFFWLKDSTNPNSELQTYRFKSVLFGTTCSPFILNATILKHLQAYDSSTTKMIERDLYVDNILSSVSIEQEAMTYFRESREIMSKAGFNLRSWTSNSEEIRTLAKQENVLDKDSHTKVLGLLWDSKSDRIFYPKRDIGQTSQEAVTKREILKFSSKIFDPLGLLSPVTVRAKILIQDLWKGGFDWDEPVPELISSTWRNIATDIQEAAEIEIPRFFFQTSDSTKDLTLHVFTDASLKAYGATVYLSNGIETTLVMAKTRIAPVKSLTLPQLELMGAVIGSRLADHVNSVFNCQNVTFWSDSSIVLSWLKTKKPLKRFISNRIREIQDLSNKHEWRYCPTECNPADLLTRGINAEQFKNSAIWRQGPKWLTDHEQWPKSIVSVKTVLSTIAENDEVSCVQDESVPQNIGHIIDINRIGTYKKLIRVTAYVQRFMFNCRNRNSRKTGNLSTDELDFASRTWISNCQENVYRDEMESLRKKEAHLNKSSRVRQLGLFLDKFNLIRCRGRIQNAVIPESAKFPYLLPANHQLTRLIVTDAHERFLHSGLNATISYLRQTYWIPCVRQCVKKILHKCVTCRKVIGRPYEKPESPPLPKIRLVDDAPFTITGVDFTGALHVRNQSGTLCKAYICLFTCATTRAVHLEVVQNLSVPTFIQCFRRFVSRKSLPRLLISDNASTFVAGSKEIQRLSDSKDLKETLSKHGVEWKFIPKRAPWYGGFWERLIGLTKTSLKKVLGRSQIDMDTLQTIIVEIESTLNDRPLTYPSSDMNDCEALTPAHLLYGRRISDLPYPQTSVSDINEIPFITDRDLNKRAKQQALLMQHFRKRWKSEYVTSLREFHKLSGKTEQSVKLGDVVQIHDESSRVNWKMGVIKELFKGNDGLVRAVRIKTKFGETTRPIAKLYPLEVTEHNDSNKDDSDELDVSTRKTRQASVKAKDRIRKWIFGQKYDDDNGND